MSADTNPSKTDLSALFGEAVEQASPEDLLAEAKAAGQDTERIAAEVKNTLLEAVRGFEQRKLRAARSLTIKFVPAGKIDSDAGKIQVHRCSLCGSLVTLEGMADHIRWHKL